MQVSEAVRTVLAVRAYQDKAVSHDSVRRILEAGRLTASGMNRQPWRFIVVTDREMLQKLGAAISSGPYVADAALAIVVVIERTRLAVSDGSRAIQSMILAAWEEGIGSNWAGFMGPEEVKALLDIPDEMDVLGTLPLGYPVEEIGQGKKKRKPLAEVAHAERFGRPFSAG
ncbi:MAG: nitroreductase [Caldilineaceae bacterium]|nr:nitroreductase [Caldilineaceae bacterium]